MRNITRRKAAVLAMECLVRSCNDEELIMPWLMNGVPDGDINKYSIDEVDDYFVDDENFASLMGLFLRIMAQAEKEGGLYIDGVVST